MRLPSHASCAYRRRVSLALCEEAKHIIEIYYSWVLFGGPKCVMCNVSCRKFHILKYVMPSGIFFAHSLRHSLDCTFTSPQHGIRISHIFRQLNCHRPTNEFRMDACEADHNKIGTFSAMRLNWIHRKVEHQIVFTHSLTHPLSLTTFHELHKIVNNNRRPKANATESKWWWHFASENNEHEEEKKNSKRREMRKKSPKPKKHSTHSRDKCFSTEF